MDDVLSAAHKCIKYAYNYNHNCPQEVKEEMGCTYDPTEEDNKMLVEGLPKEVWSKLEEGENVEELTDREEKILRLYYIEDKTCKQIGYKVDLTGQYVSQQ